jgi:hypothetical protein
MRQRNHGVRQRDCRRNVWHMVMMLRRRGRRRGLRRRRRSVAGRRPLWFRSRGRRGGRCGRRRRRRCRRTGGRRRRCRGGRRLGRSTFDAVRQLDQAVDDQHDEDRDHRAPRDQQGPIPIPGPRRRFRCFSGFSSPGVFRGVVRSRRLRAAGVVTGHPRRSLARVVQGTRRIGRTGACHAPMLLMSARCVRPADSPRRRTAAGARGRTSPVAADIPAARRCPRTLRARRRSRSACPPAESWIAARRARGR